MLFVLFRCLGDFRLGDSHERTVSQLALSALAPEDTSSKA